MAPIALCRKHRCRTFDSVRDGERQASTYERAWHRLASRGQGYPNSAAFVQDVWKGPVSMFLCEIDRSTAAELRTWAQDRNGIRVAEGDWRKAFDKGLPNAPLTLLSFDPYRYSCERGMTKPGHLYASDLERLHRALDAVRGGVLVQLSTYAADGNNPQGAVISSVDETLAPGFRQAAVVRVSGTMMSLVYGRGITWLSELEGIPRRFTDWLDTHR